MNKRRIYCVLSYKTGHAVDTHMLHLHYHDQETFKSAWHQTEHFGVPLPQFYIKLNGYKLTADTVNLL